MTLLAVSPLPPPSPWRWARPESDLEAAAIGAACVAVDARCEGASGWEHAEAIGPTLAFRGLGAAVRAGAPLAIVITDWPPDGLPPEGMPDFRAVSQAGAHAIAVMAAKSSEGRGVRVLEIACAIDPWAAAESAARQQLGAEDER